MTEGGSIRFPSKSHEVSKLVTLNPLYYLQVFLSVNSPEFAVIRSYMWRTFVLTLLSIPTGPDSCIPRLLWVPLHASAPNGAGIMPVLGLARCVECFRPWQYTHAFRVCWLTVGGPVTQSTDDLGAQIRFYTVLHLFHCVYRSLAAAIPTSAGVSGLINWLTYRGIRTVRGTASSYLLNCKSLEI